MNASEYWVRWQATLLHAVTRRSEEYDGNVGEETSVGEFPSQQEETYELSPRWEHWYNHLTQVYGQDNVEHKKPSDSYYLTYEELVDSLYAGRGVFEIFVVETTWTCTVWFEGADYDEGYGNRTVVSTRQLVSDQPDWCSSGPEGWCMGACEKDSSS